MRAVPPFLLSFLVLLSLGTRLKAQTLHLTLGGTVLHFPSADPSSVPSIPAQENPITIAISTVGLGTWTVTLLAGGDLQSGTDTIPISKMHWTASGTAFVSGTVNKLIPQSLGAGVFGGSATQGTLQFYLDNSWTYPVGTYTQTLLLTAISL